MRPVAITARAQRAPREQRAEPIVKWAGGKKRLLPELLPRLPETFGRYYEPFLGGAALFFRIQPEHAVLTDVNPELVNLYRVVKQDVESLIEHLQRHRYEKDYYYAVRAQDPGHLSELARASRTLFLNRTCFNGLYRVNRRGGFNVPFGRYTNPKICNAPRLRAVRDALSGCHIAKMDYASSVAQAQAGDFVYFDPPYVPLTKTANFTSYTRASFGEAHQRELAASFDALTARGVRCMLSNSDTPLVHELYGHHRVDLVQAPRAISRTAAGRASVSEVIVRNY